MNLEDILAGVEFTRRLDEEKLSALTAETTRMLREHSDVKEFCIVGSALYHPEPEDLDFLVLVDRLRFIPQDEDDDDTAARWMFGTDWHLCCGEYSDTDGTWGAVRNGDVNLIVTVDPEWYKRAKLANEVCHALKLMDKGDRIVVYRVVRDGYDAAAANARRDGAG